MGRYGPLIKDVCNLERGGLSSANKESFSDADVRIFGAKNLQIFEIYGVSARTKRELSQYVHFADKK